MNLTKEDEPQLREAKIMTIHDTFDLIHKDIVIFSLLEENQIGLKKGFITKQDLLKNVEESGNKIFTVLDNLGYICDAPMLIIEDKPFFLKDEFATIINDITNSLKLYQGEVHIIHALSLLKVSFSEAYERLKKNKILDDFLQVNIEKILTGEIGNYT